MASTRVMIVDDHEIVRSGLLRLIELEPDLQVVGEAGSGELASQIVERLQPDVILMDIAMPGVDGIASLREIKARLPQVKILMLTIHTESYLGEALRAGADGYLSKNISGAELARAIRAAINGEAPVHISMPSAKLQNLAESLDKEETVVFTDRQTEIMRLVRAGRSNAEIAEALFLSERTIKRELSAIFDLLGVSTRAEVAAYASKLE